MYLHAELVEGNKNIFEKFFNTTFTKIAFFIEMWC